MDGFSISAIVVMLVVIFLAGLVLGIITHRSFSNAVLIDREAFDESQSAIRSLKRRTRFLRDEYQKLKEKTDYTIDDLREVDERVQSIVNRTTRR